MPVLIPSAFALELGGCICQNSRGPFEGGAMTYWFNLFTGKSWGEFCKAGAKISGFRETQRARAQKVKPGSAPWW